MDVTVSLQYPFTTSHATTTHVSKFCDTLTLTQHRNSAPFSSFSCNNYFCIVYSLCRGSMRLPINRLDGIYMHASTRKGRLIASRLCGVGGPTRRLVWGDTINRAGCWATTKNCPSHTRAALIARLWFGIARQPQRLFISVHY